MKNKFISQERGTALVGVLMILLVLTILGTNAFLTSLTDLKISTNYHQNLQASYAAEAGIHHLLSVYRQNPEWFWQKKTGSAMNFPIDETVSIATQKNRYWLQELHYDTQTLPSFVDIIMIGKDPEHNGLSRVRATIFGFRSAGPIPPIFQKGIITDGQLHLDGVVEVIGNLHANRGYEINPPAMVAQLKENHYTVTQSLDPNSPDYLAPIDVPTISAQKFQEYRSLAQQSGNQLLVGRQNLQLSGDQNNRFIFIDGDLVLQGDNLSGITIAATGSITLNGSTRPIDNYTLNTAFIAGQDIIFNDFSQMAGVFWSNTTVKKIGSGKVMGSVVCQGSISLVEEVRFERNANISNVILSPSLVTNSFVLNGGSQM